MSSDARPAVDRRWLLAAFLVTAATAALATAPPHPATFSRRRTVPRPPG